MTRKTMTALVLTTIAGGAHADLIEADDAFFGTDSVTLDTDTGLEWLDLTESQGLSYNEVVAGMGAGGTYEGWRYASVAEVYGPLTNAGIPDVGSTSVANIAPAQSLMDLIGSTSFQAGIGDGRQANGITGDPRSGGRVVVVLDGTISSGVPQMIVDDTLTYGESFGPDSVGSWLVRVPSPSGSALLAMGGLVAARRRRG